MNLAQKGPSRTAACRISWGNYDIKKAIKYEEELEKVTQRTTEGTCPEKAGKTQNLCVGVTRGGLSRQEATQQSLGDVSAFRCWTFNEVHRDRAPA